MSELIHEYYRSLHNNRFVYRIHKFQGGAEYYDYSEKRWFMCYISEPSRISMPVEEAERFLALIEMEDERG